MKDPNIILSLNGLITVGISVLLAGVLFLIIYYLINIGNRYVPIAKRINVSHKFVRKVLLYVLILAITFFIVDKYKILGTVLRCSIFSAVLAYILNPLVNKLEENKIKRTYGVGIVYIVIFLVIVILGIAVLPKTIAETRNLMETLPQYADNSARMLNNFLQNIGSQNPNSEVDDTINAMTKYVTRIYSTLSNSLAKGAEAGAQQFTRFVTQAISNTINAFLSLALVLIMTFYFLVDKSTYQNKLEKFIPNKLRDDLDYVGTEINTVLSEFIRGRVILALFVGVLTAILLLVMRVDFAIIIGIVTCVADIVPYIGPLMGFVPAFLFALVDSPIKAVIVAVFYVFIQWMENNLLAPKIIGDSMGLNPLFIFLSIVIGGGIFGVWGMVFSVPFAAVGMVLIKFLIKKYKNKKM